MVSTHTIPIYNFMLYIMMPPIDKLEFCHHGDWIRQHIHILEHALSTSWCSHIPYWYTMPMPCSVYMMMQSHTIPIHKIMLCLHRGTVTHHTYPKDLALFTSRCSHTIPVHKVMFCLHDDAVTHHTDPQGHALSSRWYIHTPSDIYPIHGVVKHHTKVLGHALCPHDGGYTTFNCMLCLHSFKDIHLSHRQVHALSKSWWRLTISIPKIMSYIYNSLYTSQQSQVHACGRFNSITQTVYSLTTRGKKTAPTLEKKFDVRLFSTFSRCFLKPVFVACYMFVL